MALLLSELTSHTAATNMIGPLAITAAISAGMNPVPVSVAIALSASLGFMLPVSTPPNAIVYASGYIPITKMIRTGVYIDVIGIACVTIRSASTSSRGSSAEQLKITIKCCTNGYGAAFFVAKRVSVASQLLMR